MVRSEMMSSQLKILTLSEASLSGTPERPRLISEKGKGSDIILHLEFVLFNLVQNYVAKIKKT